MNCSACGKSFDHAAHDGICPKCGAFHGNRASSAPTTNAYAPPGATSGPIPNHGAQSQPTYAPTPSQNPSSSGSYTAPNAGSYSAPNAGSTGSAAPQWPPVNSGSTTQGKKKFNIGSIIALVAIPMLINGFGIIQDSISYIADAVDPAPTFSLTAEEVAQIQGNLDAQEYNPNRPDPDIDYSQHIPLREAQVLVVDGEIVEFLPADGNETIPQFVDIPEGVTTIPSYIFAGNTGLRQVNFPRSLEVVEAFAFDDCSNLMTVEFYEGLTTVEEGAFYGTALESVELPESVETIASLAFGNCELLEDVTLPSEIVNISGHSFLGTPYEHEMINNGDYWMAGDHVLLFLTGGEGETVTVPEDTLHIATGALYFYRELPDEIVIPDGVLTLASGAFDSDLSGEMTLEIPASVRLIGDLSQSNYGNADITIRCVEGSAAHDYAVKNDHIATFLD